MFSLITLASVVWFSACAPPDPTVVYTNLVEPAEQAQLIELLEQAKLADVDLFFGMVNRFNAAQPPEAGLATGFVPATDKKYDVMVMDDSFQKRYPNEPDFNCRLTVFSLVCGSLQSDGLSDYGNYLMFDVDSLENYAPWKKLLEKKNDYIALFNEVPAAGVAEADLAKTFRQALAQRGVNYTNRKATIVEVVMYDPDEKVLFVGHTGLLFHKNGYYWFLEKLSPLNPYQLTRYPNKAELLTELKNRPAYLEEGAPAPIIIELPGA